MESSEIEQNVNKIKELLKSEDFSKQSAGLHLAKSLNEAAIYEKLLDGCGVDKNGGLIYDYKKLSCYAICALSSQSNVPTAQFIKEKLKWLEINEGIFENLDGLAKLSNLQYIELNYCPSLNNIDGLAYLTQLIAVDFNSCEALEEIEVLSKLTNLTDLNFKDCDLIEPWMIDEVKKKLPHFMNKISMLNFSVDLNYIQKIFMEEEVKNITELIALLDSIFKKVASSIDTLDELYTVVQKAKHTDNIDKCKTKVKANIKDEFSYIEKRNGYDFNDSDQLYNLLVEDREMLEINDEVEDDGEILIFKNIEVNAEITTLNSELLDSTRWWNWLTIEAREEETNKYRTYQHGEVVNEESNF